MAQKPELRFDTLALHGGHTPDTDHRACAVPVYMTSSYLFRDSDHAARLFALEEEGHIYTRLSNPTTAVLEQRVAMLEGGAAGVAFASGMAAITAAILTIMGHGDETVASTGLYGGTHTLLRHTLPEKMGVRTAFVAEDTPEAFDAAATERTRLFYVESLGNPRLTVPDFAGIAEAAHARGVPLMVDNTMASPWLCRPIEHGADIVVHSLTKYLNGHGNSIGGMVVDGGRFDWAASGRFPEMVEPNEAYHGVRFVEQFGEAAYAAKLRAHLLRDLGGCLSPMNAFLTLQGVETLGLRMQRHCANAAELARFLADHPKVAWVNYPGLPDHPTHALAARYLSGGFGGMIGFGVRGGLQAGRRVIDALRLICHLANIGDARSLAIHPASTTHGQLSEDELRQTGVTPDFIRFSVGLEDVEDLKEDLDQALARA